MSAHANRATGTLLMIAAELCWATAGVMVRSQSVTNGWEITWWRSFFMVLFLLVVLRVRGSIVQQLRAAGVAGLVSGLLLAIMMVCFIIAISRTNVANVLIIAATSPFFAALLGYLFLREQVPMRTWLAMLVAFAGMALTFADGVSMGGVAGILIAFAIPVAYGFNIIILRRMHASVDMVPALMLGGLLSALLAFPFSLPFTAAAADLAWLGLMGVLQLGIGCILMMRAVRHLSAAEIGLFSPLEAIFGTLSVWLLIGEHPGIAALYGGLMVVGALVVNEFVAWRRARPAVA
jgi:drug/metabolite transporter (DMT)-like permease